MKDFNGEVVDILSERKEHREYFSGELVSLATKEIARREIRRYGFLGLRKEVKIVHERQYSAILKVLSSDDVQFRVPITKELYNTLLEEKKVGQKVSIHLYFKYDFTCWHIANKCPKEVLDVI